MRWVVGIGVLVLIMALIGWLRFDNQGGNPSIELDTKKMKQDTKEGYDWTKEAVGVSPETEEGS